MRVHVLKSQKEISKQAAAHIIELVKNKPNAVLGLATGSSPLGVYDELIRDYKNHQRDYRLVKTYNLDEYLGLDQNHPQSYFQFMKTHLFDHLNFDSKHIHMPDNHIMHENDACESYNQLLEKSVIDIQLLGLGSNGHIGFNEPLTPFDSKTHIIALDQKTRQDNARFFESLDEVPTHAITMGIQNIMDANHIVLIAMGKKKSQAVYEMVLGPITTKCPASILQNHPHVDIYLDEDAASLLNEKAFSY